MTSIKAQITSSIKNYLQNRSDVLFVYLFGSFVREDRYRDVDVGVYTVQIPDLMAIGRMQADLSALLDPAVDVIPMNQLTDKSPVLAYQIVTEGQLLFTKDRKRHTLYKKQVLLTYFDTAPLREKMEKAFQERLSTGQFGKVKT